MQSLDNFCDLQGWCISGCLWGSNLQTASKTWVKEMFFFPSSVVFSVDCSTVECPPVQQVVCPLDSYETQVRLTADGCCTLPTRLVSRWLSIFNLFLTIRVLWTQDKNANFCDNKCWYRIKAKWCRLYQSDGNTESCIFKAEKKIFTVQMHEVGFCYNYLRSSCL